MSFSCSSRVVYTGLCIWLCASFINAVVREVVHVDDEHGIVLIKDGSVWTLSTVESVPVLIRLSKDHLPATVDVCGDRVPVYKDIIDKYFDRIVVGSRIRRKRFLPALSFLTSIFGSALGVKNWFDSSRLEADLHDLKNQQILMFNLQSQSIYKVNKDLIHLESIATAIRQQQNHTTRRLMHVECKLSFLLNNTARMAHYAVELDSKLSTIANIVSGTIRSQDIENLLSPDIIDDINERSKNGSVPPPTEHLARLVTVVNGHVDLKTMTYSLLLLVPFFNTQPSTSYYILNTGYFRDDNVHMICDLHGLVAYHEGTYYSIHPGDCTVIGKDFFCPPNALVPDSRISLINKSHICSPSRIRYNPVLAFRDGWIACTGMERVIRVESGAPPAWYRQTLQSQNGFFLLSRKNITRATIGNHTFIHTYAGTLKVEIPQPHFESVVHRLPEETVPIDSIPLTQIPMYHLEGTPYYSSITLGIVGAISILMISNIICGLVLWMKVKASTARLLQRIEELEERQSIVTRMLLQGE